MVDTVGGVEVCSTKPLKDDELGTVLADAGRQIDRRRDRAGLRAGAAGHQRERGDYGRIKRQQLFLSSLLRSLISKEVFFDPGQARHVVNMFTGHTYVDNTGPRIWSSSAGRCRA